jgi:hypothetical protein
MCDPVEIERLFSSEAVIQMLRNVPVQNVAIGQDRTFAFSLISSSLHLCFWATTVSKKRPRKSDSPSQAKILTHLGLPAHAPPRSPARRVDLFQAA